MRTSPMAFIVLLRVVWNFRGLHFLVGLMDWVECEGVIVAGGMINFFCLTPKGKDVQVVSCIL